MYTVIDNNGKYEIHVKGLVKMNMRPIVVLNDKESANDYCENLNIAYECGYEAGINSK